MEHLNKVDKILFRILLGLVFFIIGIFIVFTGYLVAKMLGFYWMGIIKLVGLGALSFIFLYAVGYLVEKILERIWW